MVKFRLREILDTKGMGQTEAARLSGVSFATVNRMCTNATRRVDLDVLEKLAKVLRVKPGAILE